jgi:lysophospholipase L1-like esterase
MTTHRSHGTSSHLPLVAGLWLLIAAPSSAQRPEDRPLPPPPPVHAEFKFDFGPGAPRAGYVHVSPETVYSSELGYGFDFGSKPLDSARGGTDPLAGGFVTTAEPPFFFSVKAPEGNYRITVTLGDAQSESRTTIRTEAGHLMAADIVTAAGKFTTRTFYANVRRPQLPPPPKNAPGGSEVHMFLAGEAEARCWDEKLTIELNGSRPCLGAMEIVKDDAVPTIFVAGDSTVGDPRRGPGGNWPTQICQFFKPEVAVCNSAEGGETSKSFLTGYRLDKVLSQMKAGDFFLVQFGHNDSKVQWPQSYTEPGTTFDAYLRVFIAETRRRGATPVFVTPMERRANGDSVGPWARAMRDVAARENVLLIDQWTLSKQLWTALGADVNQAFSDQTHLRGYGGYLLAKLIVGEIKRSVPALARLVVDDFKAMDPAHPELPPEYLRQAPGPAPSAAPTPRAGLRLPDFHVHDPWILADKSRQTYFLYSSASPGMTGQNRSGTLFYKSKDLARWEGPFIAFVCPDDSWADPRQGAWAPEVHAYQGKYYLFTTLHNPRKPLPTANPARPNLMRSTMIALSDSPEGPFTLIRKDAPVAPPDFMILDGTFYVDPAGQPWMVYAHEWMQKVDGTIEALPLKADLSAAAGDPIFLFKGSDAPWLDEQAAPNARGSLYVTDGPELFRTKDGHLLMLWSSYEKNSFGLDGYVETLARSKSGGLIGPWEQLPPLVRNDSGHGMLFHSFDGQLMLVLHQPFLEARGKIYEVEDLGDNLRVGKYRDDLSGPALGPQRGQTPQ